MSDPKAYFDYDAWYTEHAAATIPFRLLGEEWEVPGDVPAATLLKYERLQQYTLEAQVDPDADLPAGLSLDDVLSFTPDGMARELVGDQIVDAWHTKGITTRLLRVVARRLFATYRGEDPDAAIGLGKAPAPKEPTDRKPKAAKGKRSTSSAGS